MKIEPKRCTLKNGKEVLLASPTAKDAAQLIAYMKKTAEESENLVRYPEELVLTLQDEERMLENIEKNERECFVSAFIDGKIKGNASLSCIGERIKLKHRCGLGMAVFEEVQGIGLGSLLMDEILDHAVKFGYEQIELEVRADNEKALSLYKKKGFEECGRIYHGFKLKNGEYVDLLMMIRRLK